MGFELSFMSTSVGSELFHVRQRITGGVLTAGLPARRARNRLDHDPYWHAHARKCQAAEDPEVRLKGRSGRPPRADVSLVRKRLAGVRCAHRWQWVLLLPESHDNVSCFHRRLDLHVFTSGGLGC